MFLRFFIGLSLLFSTVTSGATSAHHIGRCETVVHLGDSTSLSMLPYLRSDYAQFNISDVVLSVGNGRSISYKKPPDSMTGIEAVRYWKNKLQGRMVCWVIALGTNDASSTSKPDDSTRIDLLMKEIGQDKVLWVNVWMDSKTRPDYSVAHAKQWNSLLLSKFGRNRNVSILDWATICKANPSWLLGDGIHYSTSGSVQRSKIITYVAGLLFA